MTTATTYNLDGPAKVIKPIGTPWLTSLPEVPSDTPTLRQHTLTRHIVRDPADTGDQIVREQARLLWVLKYDEEFDLSSGTFMQAMAHGIKEDDYAEAVRSDDTANTTPQSVIKLCFLHGARLGVGSPYTSEVTETDDGWTITVSRTSGLIWVDREE